MTNCEDVFYQEIGITCKTFARLKVIERENKMMRECLEKLVVRAEHIGAYEDAKLILNKLTKDER